MKRWIYLLLGMIANLAQGVAYASSVICVPMMEMVGVPADEAKVRFALIFTLSCCFLPIGMIAGGKLAAVSPRISIALGAVIYGAGLFASGYVRDYNTLCLTFGLMLSIGSGLAYGPIVASAVRWFPDKRGLASGLVVSALGFGPAWIAPFCAALLAEKFSIGTVLQILGVITFAAIGLASFIAPPPKNAAQAAADGANEVNWLQMLGSGRFYLLALLLFLGAVPGLMIISGAKGIFEIFGGFSGATAAALVGVLAAANALGRFLWGAVSDKIGRINTVSVMFFISSLTMAALPFAHSPALLVGVIIVIGLTYGGYLGLFPSFCADAFGAKNMALNYAVLFIAFSIAALVGP
ncbi:MAG: MFS transporter, partial [Planctomycetaceae bacterium]|nr:MFS transporter [Planctomycetaceae bacterium]